MLNLAVLSRRVRSRAWRERGMILTLDALIALLIAAGGVIGIGSALVHVMSGAGHAIQARDVFASLDRAETTLQAKADSAVALLAPPNAIGGGVNCSGGRCVSFAAYVNDSAHTPYFWALQATSKRGSSAVQPYKCSGTDASGNLSGCAADGTAIVVPQGFYFRVVPVTALASDTDTSPTTKAHLAALGITPKRVTFAFEHAGVIASNDVFYLHFGSRDTGDDVLALTARAIPAKGASLIDGHYLPTPPPTMDYGPDGPGPQVFPYPGAAPASFTVHEYQYHDPFSVATNCMMGGVQVAGISPGSAFPNPNPMTPPGQDSGPATFTTSPTAPGTCASRITDVYNQTISESVQVMGALTIANGSMVFTTPSAPPQSDNVSKTYDNSVVQASPSGCGGIAAFGVTSQTTPGSVSASPAITNFNVWPAGGAFGSCRISISDQYGESVALNVTVWQGLQVNPAFLTFPDFTQSTCQYPDGSLHSPCTISISKWGYNAPSTYLVNASACTGYASASPGSLIAAGATAATATVSPASYLPAGCRIIVSDSVGESAYVNVFLDGPPCPGGQTRDANGNCPGTVVASAAVTMTYKDDCKVDKFGQYSPGADVLDVFTGTNNNYTIGPSDSGEFVALATMTLSNANPITFTVTGNTTSDGTPGLAVSTTPTTLYGSSQTLAATGTWSGNVWTPPSVGTFYVGWFQPYYAAPGCNGDGGGGSGQQGMATVYSGPYSFTGTQN